MSSALERRVGDTRLRWPSWLLAGVFEGSAFMRSSDGLGEVRIA